MTVARHRYLLRAVASLLLVAGLIVSALAPAETPCGEGCPCDGPPGAEQHAEDTADDHEADEHDADEHDADDPCDDDCPDDCPSCGGAVVALVTPALGMPVRGGTWRAVSASVVRDTVQRSSSTGVFRPPRQLA